ncbi:MAG: hypothetical protein NTW19_10090 [Planctomycetota bacterium]|nr:hypothetical protein [Planctomycetota bacterium]
MPPKSYIEKFDQGPGGWLLWMAGGGGPLPPDLRRGAMVSRSPWGVDFNHAPPGAGYCHLLFCLPMIPADKYPYHLLDPYTGPNRFVKGGHSRNLTDAKIKVRLRGQVDLKGAQLMLLAQADVGPIRTNWTLTGQPLRITRNWSEQSLHLTPDPAQWTCMGVRSVGADTPNYGEAPIDQALLDVNVNIILILFPLDVRPFTGIGGDPHVLRAGKDYSLDRIRLPQGEVWLDTVRIDYAK